MMNCSPWRMRTRGGTDGRQIFNSRDGRPQRPATARPA